MENLTLSNKVNRKLQEFIDKVIARISGGPDSIDEGSIRSAFLFSAEDLEDAPTGPKGPSYQEMLLALFDSIKKDVGDAENKKETYVKELESHKNKIYASIEKNDAEFAKLEKEEKSKITTEGLHEGFSTSVSKVQLPR
jgi:cell division cycle protein 37